MTEILFEAKQAAIDILTLLVCATLGALLGLAILSPFLWAFLLVLGVIQ
jgi:hypothetical protein